MEVVMDIDEILELLPHRYPFLLVDRVVECDFKKHIVALKNITYNEPYFQGHFPGHPVMPGVLQLEALAQVGGLLLNKVHDRKGAVAYFISVDNARFRRMVKPGDQLRMEVNFLKARMKMAKVRGTIHVGEDLVCEADLMFAYVE
jgi:beta-hydroxyacyl-ACP dehydratase FabZ